MVRCVSALTAKLLAYPWRITREGGGGRNAFDLGRFVMQRKLKSLLFALLGMVAAASCQAQTYVVGVEQTDYFPVYAYRGGQYTGYFRDLLDAFGKKHGYQFQYTALPIKRLFADFLTKDSLDFKFPDNPVWQAPMKEGIAVSYSKPAFESTEGGMVLPENKGKTLAAVKTLGTIRGFTPWPYQDAIAAKTITLEESDDIGSLVQKALVKRLDAVFLCEAIANYYVAEVLKKPGALVIDPDLPSNPVAFLLSSRKHPQVVEQFSQFLETEKALIAELRAKHKLP